MNLERYTISWGDWLFALAFLIGLYFVLMVILGLLRRVNILGTLQRGLINFLDIVLKVYEPAVVAILIVLFIFINPYVHGLIAAIFLVLAYVPIKNYMNGRVFLLSNELEKGSRIKVKESSGMIQELGRLGLSLQTREGIQFINYSTLLEEGHLLFKEARIGGLHQLEITIPEGEGQKIKAPDLIKQRLFSSPYVDWSWTPKITMDHDSDNTFFIQLLVREDQHLQHLIQLIKEWNYDCKIAVNVEGEV